MSGGMPVNNQESQYTQPPAPSPHAEVRSIIPTQQVGLIQGSPGEYYQNLGIVDVKYGTEFTVGSEAILTTDSLVLPYEALKLAGPGAIVEITEMRTETHPKYPAFPNQEILAVQTYTLAELNRIRQSEHGGSALDPQRDFLIPFAPATDASAFYRNQQNGDTQTGEQEPIKLLGLTTELVAADGLNITIQIRPLQVQFLGPNGEMQTMQPYPDAVTTSMTRNIDQDYIHPLEKRQITG